MSDLGFHSSRRTRRSRALESGLAVLALMLLAGCSSEGSDPEGRTAVASFTQSATQGAPPTAVVFTDTSGPVISRVWDFGPLGTSTEASPMRTYDTPGTYPVTLTVTTSRGTTTVSRPAAVVIADPPTPAFVCTPAPFTGGDPIRGLSGLVVDCSDLSIGATDIVWDFGDGTTVSGRTATHTYVIDDNGPDRSFSIVQTAIGPGGRVDSAPQPVIVSPFRIETDVPSGTVAPVAVEFRVNPEALANARELIAFFPGADWTVDGVMAPGGDTLSQNFVRSGTSRVEAQIFFPTGQLYTRAIDYVAGSSPAMPAFAANPGFGSGPLPVTLEDASSGDVTRWTWDFGDGSGCTFPALANPTPSDPPTCKDDDGNDSESPTHTYTDIGRYAVTLTVEGPGATAGSSTTQADAVVVALLDGSFEEQTAGIGIARVDETSGWRDLADDTAARSRDHEALSRNTGGTDGDMPTEGLLWAVLDGDRETVPSPDPAPDVDATTIVNGLQQSGILRPAGAPVLEFDYALLYNEPPAALAEDVFVATLEAQNVDPMTNAPVGPSEIVTITNSRVTASAPYTGDSTRFPMRDGRRVRRTPVYTASIDVEDDETFEVVPIGDDTRFTLALRIANVGNDFRSPRAYVDDVRFSPRAGTAITTDFEVYDVRTGMFVMGAADPLVLVEGQSVRLVDTTCLNGSCPASCAPEQIGTGECSVATSRRWDFDTSMLASLPDASGSDDPSPAYTFPPSPDGYGPYEVTLASQLAEQSGPAPATMRITVLSAPMAEIGVSEPADTIAYRVDEPITFTDRSTIDLDEDPAATTWLWDFDGFGTSTLQDPGNMSFPARDTYTVTLTVTTESGQTSTTQLSITIE